MDTLKILSMILFNDLTLKHEVSHVEFNNFITCSLHLSFSFSLYTVYVVVGDCFEHLGLLISLAEMKLLETGKYFVVGVDVEHYDPHQAQKYFYGKLINLKHPVLTLDPVSLSLDSGILKSGNDEITRNREQSSVKDAFQSYLGIFSSPPSGFEKFSLQVNKYMRERPFQFVNPIQSDFDALRRVS